MPRPDHGDRQPGDQAGGAEAQRARHGQDPAVGGEHRRRDSRARRPGRIASVPTMGHAPTSARTTPCCWCRSGGRRGPRTSSRSWRTSPGAAASRASGSRRSASTTTSSAAGRRSTTRTASCWPRSARTSPARASTCPVYWGNRNWDPYLADTVRQMRDDGVTPGGLLHDQRLLVVLLLPAVPREPRRRGRARSPGAPRLDKLRHYFNHPGFVEPVVDATLAALAELPDDVRDGAHLVFVTHSIPTTMNDAQRPARAAPTSSSTAASPPRSSSGCARRPAAGTRHELVFCSRSGSPQVPWLEPDVNDHLEELAERRRQRGGDGADRLRLRPHGGHLRPRHRGAGDRRASSGCPASRAATAGRRPALRGRRARPAARAGRGRARRGGRRGSPSAGCRPRWDRCAVGCCPNPRGRAAGARAARRS